jgi:hypothetical protein
MSWNKIDVMTEKEHFIVLAKLGDVRRPSYVMILKSVAKQDLKILDN